MTREVPPPADASLQPIIDVLDALIQVLEQDGDTHWSAWMRRAKSRLAQGDDRGADDLLGAYGGMGSFNDLILGQSYQDGRFAWKPGYADLNERFDALRGRAWELAQGIRRRRA
ncbi:hypothetical protein [Pseudoxanthomonas sp. X-1]|uniref:DUF6966 domain-containing protein n=1 Tax=Pseudoxanthomonas sp. X-1 TaxID=2571115 RepID=UPI00110AE19D|nr:hypothetical protein [Pseudoxanthomonas sp. X-1]TMN24282.1 hypothetical protein FF950_05625 [Pseudoxanthomonas sp. X-1]UAY73488.1 hypothetical protein LAJ50_13385 [Pseudoxanthomonas sp. X-1]